MLSTQNYRDGHFLFQNNLEKCRILAADIPCEFLICRIICYDLFYIDKNLFGR
jgi:hypothetical protein